LRRNIVNSFNFTELEAGEELVFGPVTSTKTTNVSGSSGAPGQGGIFSLTSGRTVGVTNQRVIVEDLESPDRTQVVPNANVQRVFIKRQQRQGQSSVNLVKVQTASGPVKLDIKGLPAQAEAMLESTFPNAEIVHGGGSKVGLIIAIVVLGGIFLLCVLPFIIAAVGRLFAG
jgi:hypothetical protein